MKKSLVTFICILIFAVISISATAIEYTQPIEISFRVGDSTLSVNGESMTVETPYIVGSGVTLVPVRVITEAFGAKVGWDGTEKKVTLTTDDTVINLWINNPEVQINGEKSLLLAAPELSNSVTMVPLRFISENYGASVSWDNTTKSILVTKPGEPVAKEGMRVYTDKEIDLVIPVPENYIPVNSANTFGVYEYGRNSKYYSSEYTIAYAREFTGDIIDNPEKLLKADRDAQKSKLHYDSYSVSNVEKFVKNNIEGYRYTISNVLGPNSYLRVEKTLYNFGDLSYFVLTSCDDYPDRGSERYSDDGTLQYISYDGYDLTIPKEYGTKNSKWICPMNISGAVTQTISLEFFKKPEGFDAIKMLEEKSSDSNQLIGMRHIKMSEIKEVVYGNVNCYEFTSSYYGGGAIRNIYIDEGSFFVYVRVYEETDKDDVIANSAEYIISNLSYNLADEQVDKLKTYGVTQTVKVVTQTISFELPDTFDIYMSNDKRYVVAVNRENGVVLKFYDEIAKLANQTYTINSSYGYGSPFMGITISEYAGINKVISPHTEKTKEYLETKQWSVTASKKEYRTTDSGTRTSYVYDNLLAQKHVAKNNVQVFTDIYSIFTNTNEYVLAENDENIIKIKRKLDDKYEPDMPDQKVHAFEFSYTSIIKEEQIESLKKSILETVQKN